MLIISINLLIFYLFYELGLLLIFFIALKWGYRENRWLYLTFYTLVFSSPFLLVKIPLYIYISRSIMLNRLITTFYDFTIHYIKKLESYGISRLITMLSLLQFIFAVETNDRGKRKIREANVTLIIRISWFRNDSSITANDGSTSNAFPQGLVSSFPLPRPREMNTPSWRHLMPGAHNAPPPLLFCRPLWSAQINRDQRLVMGQLPRPNRIEIVNLEYVDGPRAPIFQPNVSLQSTTIIHDADVRNEIFHFWAGRIQLFDRAE